MNNKTLLTIRSSTDNISTIKSIKIHSSLSLRNYSAGNESLKRFCTIICDSLSEHLFMLIESTNSEIKNLHVNFFLIEALHINLLITLLDLFCSFSMHFSLHCFIYSYVKSPNILITVILLTHGSSSYEVNQLN